MHGRVEEESLGVHGHGEEEPLGMGEEERQGVGEEERLDGVGAGVEHLEVEGGGGGRRRAQEEDGGGFRVLRSICTFSPGRNKVPNDLYFRTEGVQRRSSDKIKTCTWQIYTH